MAKENKKIEVNVQNSGVTEEVMYQQTFVDFKNAAFTVSVLVNLFVLTTWLVVGVTDAYNASVISLL